MLFFMYQSGVDFKCPYSNRPLMYELSFGGNNNVVRKGYTTIALNFK
jgi:hypothetical protein